MVTANGTGPLSEIAFSIRIVAVGVVTANGAGPLIKLSELVLMNKKEREKKKKNKRETANG